MAKKSNPVSTQKSKALKPSLKSGPLLKMDTRFVRSKCPINLLLEVVGDSWSLLIIRDLMFKGRSTYKAFLGAEEKIATNILADRLSKLETSGLISKGNDPEDARKFIYRLTEKGADLAPVLVEMMLWSNKYNLTDTPKDILASMQKNRTAFVNKVVRDVNLPPKPTPAPRGLEFKDETLNLFDGF
jgi:DNA-binding HxlR family transcriptional regulator